MSFFFQFLVEYVIRSRIYEAAYWKEHCFALTGGPQCVSMALFVIIVLPTAESLIDKAIALRNIGGVYGNQKPTEFMCLLLKLLQIQPEKEILVEYLLVDEFKCIYSPLVSQFGTNCCFSDIYELWQPCTFA